MKKIGIIVGSLRENSFNKTVAAYIGAQLGKSYDVQMIDISMLPLYNQDLETDQPPKEWSDFRNQIKEMDAFLFATPEYNRSFSAVLKNALDVGSRPYTENLWSNKPCAAISVSIGKVGGFGANNHLRQVLTFLNLLTMPQPEAYIGEIERYLDEKGNISNEQTKAFLNQFADAFSSWIERF